MLRARTRRPGVFRCVGIGVQVRRNERSSAVGIGVQVAPEYAPLGSRDFALFLMVATYGMGAGEVCALTLDGIDWTAMTVRIRRPKAGVVTLLPLLDPVARALARYLRDERPAHAQDRAVFVTSHLPHRRLACSTTIRHRLDGYARAAAVHADFLGTRVLRHAHAPRQIEGGASVKVVGDILGHRRPSSTSVYPPQSRRHLDLGLEPNTIHLRHPSHRRPTVTLRCCACPLQELRGNRLPHVALLAPSLFEGHLQLRQ